MKYIEKEIANEPRTLVETRSTPGATFDGCNKNDIRKALLLEQGYLCAYCMRRINNKLKKGKPNTRIEHYLAQSTDENLRMNYSNMLGVCDGNEGQPEHLLHCDQSRKNTRLSINPLDPRCEDLVQYRADGKLYSRSEDIDEELKTILRLNNENLVKGRRQAIDTARDAMMKRSRGRTSQSFSRSSLTREIAKWKSKKNQRHIPFCQAAIAYLEKKLARL